MFVEKNNNQTVLVGYGLCTFVIVLHCFVDTLIVYAFI